ncbi:hypothetical protein JW960_12350 [candidate division KSB1 bacterium]|nr:hypothetical protein [candidate division KSB1 bacterium]
MLDFSDVSDDILVNAISHSNMNAFQLLYERYFQKVLQFVWTRSKSIEMCDTIIEETFVRLWAYRTIIYNPIKYKIYLIFIAANYIMKPDQDPAPLPVNGNPYPLDQNQFLCIADITRTISTDEKIQLHTWLNENPANQEYYFQLAQTCKHKADEDLPFSPDRDAIWQKVEKRITPHHPQQQSFTFQRIVNFFKRTPITIL